VSVCTRAYVDGAVTVRLAARLTDAQKNGCNINSRHVIQSPGRRIAVVTSENERLFEIAVPADTARLTVSVDDARSPSMVCIEAT
jgi:hypothetical protein